jgi:hypothetical protein
LYRASIKLVLNINYFNRYFQAETGFGKYPEKFDRNYRQWKEQQEIRSVELRNEMDKSYLLGYPILLRKSTDMNA